MPCLAVSYILLDMSEHLTHTESDENGGEMAPAVYSVSEISSLIRNVVEDEFAYVRIQGEISGFMRAASGHMYFSLKDEDALIEAVCWRGTASKLGVKPEDGLEVIVTGRITTYGPRSKYQVVVEQMEVAGEGALLKLLEDRKRKLSAEGLFDESAKQDLPYLPNVIGVVTSPTGAVIRDILHRLADRFPVRVIVWPVLVQGDGAAGQISDAINGFNALGEGGAVPRPDLLIVARGGGSIEDLWAFNEEAVVRATAASDIPLISAVGHETDTTLIDYASDLRAPTPTAAAELAVPVKSELIAELADEAARLIRAASRIKSQRQVQLDGLVRALPKPRNLLGLAAQRLDDWSGRLGGSLKGGVERRRRRLSEATAALRSPKQRLGYASTTLAGQWNQLRRATQGALQLRSNKVAQLDRLLDGLSYQRVLDRGFAWVTGPDGRTITRAAKLKVGDDVGLTFTDGALSARISGNKAPTKQLKAKKRKERKKDGRQGELL